MSSAVRPISFLLHDQATVRLAMQNYGKTPAVIREWLVEFLAQEPRGRKPAYDASKRTVTNEILEPFKLVLAGHGVPLGDPVAVLYRRLHCL